MNGMKNIDKSTVLRLKEQVAYQPGQVVSRTLAQNDALSVTLFSFDKDEEISTHASGGDAFVTCLDGVGRITIDGVATTDLRREDVHELFGMVLQDTWLFEGTIRENLVYNMEGITDEQLETVCKACGLDKFVHSLPQGFDTVLSESTTISAGQKQLLTIARAMLQNAPMLILDEATSSVDTRTELLIQRAMDELTKGRTSFVIAHRLSTIKNADLILVMRDGDVIESGTHEQLMEQNGFYAELYNSQFAQAS